MLRDVVTLTDTNVHVSLSGGRWYFSPESEKKRQIVFPTRAGAGGRCSPLIAPPPASHYFAFKSEESDESEAISHAIPIPCGEMRKKSGEQLLLVARSVRRLIS